MTETIFTIGHSTHPMEEFLRLLSLHSVTTVCDVRSSPYSRFNPQFNRERFGKELQEAGIAYIFMGRELGARTDDKPCYIDGKVQYDRLAKTAAFNDGLKLIKEESKTRRLALVCAERDPLQCHRTILVSRHLANDGVPVIHIGSDGAPETHDEAINRLLRHLRLAESDMFQTREEVIADAYRLQGAAIAYVDKKASQSTEPAQSGTR